MVKTEEVGIYKKKTRKNAFDQESDQEKKNKERKNALDQEKNFLFFLTIFLVESVFSFIFLTFLFSFMNSRL